MKKGSTTVATYLQEIRLIVDALKLVGSLVADDELAVKILSGPGHKHREITTAIRARDTSLSFEELFQKLTDYELFLKHQDIDRSSSIITNGRLPRQGVKCQLCQKIDHTADVCRSKSHNHFEAKVNFVSNHQSDANPWILDSRATHHVATESDNLEEYTGNKEVFMGDGSQNSETASTRLE
ncbi:hypothetical protein KY284_033268 [Solanum tuberosum]|nr:hypothetical protein KY284_033268 [Solanum tuberosum]